MNQKTRKLRKPQRKGASGKAASHNHSDAWRRPRAVRDPIHGDISLGPVQAAVVGSLVFQRLRYIRQNGLLHFIFPGAVHTRFAHSLGTMAVAARVWDRLLLPVSETLRQKYHDSIAYVETVFQLAALLHDVGHCAFSHSIETVQIEGKSFLGSVRELFRSWDEDALGKEYLAAHPKDGQMDAKHEQIGLILTRHIFDEDRVREACTKYLGGEGSDVGRDVRAIHDDGLKPSRHLAFHLERLAEMYATLGATVSLYKGLTKSNFPQDLRAILHVLISGTLDVDRLDYLIRDSTFLGTPYGICDTRILVNGLDIGVVGEHAELLLDVKATFALDDLLWSRYQMFMQVYNHKTNVALNTMLARAIPEALDDARFQRPKDFQGYIEFTDDLVMSTVLSLCIRGKKLARTAYGKTLAYRQIPLHLGFELLTGRNAKEIEAEIREKTRKKAKEAKVQPKDLITARTTSELLTFAWLMDTYLRPRQVRSMNAGPKQSLRPSDAMDDMAESAAKLNEVLGRTVCQRILGFGPHELVRVDLRGVSREPIHMEPLVSEQKLFDDDASVDSAAIPQEHDRSPQMSEKVAQESDDLYAGDVGAVKTEVKSEAFARRGDGKAASINNLYNSLLA